jgi:hypothetical protein
MLAAPSAYPLRPIAFHEAFFLKPSRPRQKSQNCPADGAQILHSIFHPAHLQLQNTLKPCCCTIPFWTSPFGREEKDKDISYVTTSGALAAPVNGTITESENIVAVDTKGYKC